MRRTGGHGQEVSSQGTTTPSGTPRSTAASENFTAHQAALTKRATPLPTGGKRSTAALAEPHVPPNLHHPCDYSCTYDHKGPADLGGTACTGCAHLRSCSETWNDTASYPTPALPIPSEPLHPSCRRHQVSRWPRYMEKGTLELPMLAWSAAPLLLGDLLLYYSSDCERLWGKPGRVTWVGLDTKATMSVIPVFI